MRPFLFAHKINSPSVPVSVRAGGLLWTLTTLGLIFFRRLTWRESCLLMRLLMNLAWR